MLQRNLFVGLLVLSLNISELCSLSENESVAWFSSSIALKPKTQNVSYQTNFLSASTSFSNQIPTVYVSKSLSSSNSSISSKSSVTLGSSVIGSILLSTIIKDERISLLRTVSIPTQTMPLSFEFTPHSSLIPQYALSPTHISLPSVVYFTTKIIIATSTTSREAMTKTTATVHVEPTPSRTTSTSSITAGHLSPHTSVNRGTDRSASVRRARENSVTLNSVQSTMTLGVTSSLSSTIASTISTVDTVTQNPQTTEMEEAATTRTRTTISIPGVTTPAVIGVVVSGTLVLIALALLVLLLCYCFRRSRKYEYCTGNEYRVTVQKWNAQFTHYTVNQCESASSSRGSSLLSIWSSNGMKPRCGGVSSAADHLHSVVHSEMYSTPL